MKKLYILIFVVMCAEAVRGQEGTNSQNLTFSVNNVIFEMVFVEGGTFAMGCTPEQGNDCLEREKPAHKVTVGNFYIGKYPITQAQWKAVMEYYPIELHNTGCDSCPVERVSWEDAQEFITKLKTLTNKIYRLPTEAEWEFAARGGKKSMGYKYSGSNNIDEVAWYSGNYERGKYGREGSTHPVGIKKPNELGIYDMSGNVWEWCMDWYDKSYYEHSPLSGVRGAKMGTRRVVRGGCWRYGASMCRVSYRNGHTPNYLYDFIGFRLVLVP